MVVEHLSKKEAEFNPKKEIGDFHLEITSDPINKKIQETCN